MLERIAERNERVWAGHSRLLEDSTHAIGGIGIGLLACSPLRQSTRGVGVALLALSAALHVYALATARRRMSFFGS